MHKCGDEGKVKVSELPVKNVGLDPETTPKIGPDIFMIRDTQAVSENGNNLEFLLNRK